MRTSVNVWRADRARGLNETPSPHLCPPPCRLLTSYPTHYSPTSEITLSLPSTRTRHPCRDCRHHHPTSRPSHFPLSISCPPHKITKMKSSPPPLAVSSDVEMTQTKQSEAGLGRKSRTWGTAAYLLDTLTPTRPRTRKLLPSPQGCHIEACMGI